MKSILFISILLLVSCIAFSQNSSQQPNQEINTLQIVEASCGQCQFGLKGKGCKLAIRINGKSYFVDGANIDQFGDAHDNDGFCNAIRKAEVTGNIVDGRFKARSFTLLPASEQKK